MTLTRVVQVAVVGFLIVTAYGCATVQFGKEFDSTMFESSVQIGVTTQTDIRTWLGGPVSTGIIVDEKAQRFTRWIYYSGKGRLPSLRDSKFKMLEVRFDDQQIVRAYNWSSSE